MRVEIIESIDQIPPAVWNEVVGEDRLICRHEYLQAIEQSQINDCRFFYPVIYDGARLVAHACAYFITTDLDTFAQGLARDAVDAIRRVWRSAFRLKSVECGSPVALGSTIAFRPDQDPRRIVPLIADAVETVAKRLGARTILFRDFLRDRLAVVDVLQDLGYTRVENLPSARMPIVWSSFEEYRHSLRSDYRRKLANRTRTFLDAGGSLEWRTDFGEYAHVLAELWAQAYRHAREYRREFLKPVFFRNIDRLLGEKSIVILALVKGAIVGFCLLLADDPLLTWLFCGLDYRCSRDYCTYFNMIYAIVENAIQRGFREIDMGITTLIPKMDVGATVVPQYMFMKHFNPLLNAIVPRVFSAMKPRAIPIARRVFR